MKQQWKVTIVLMSIVTLSVFFHLPIIHWALAHNVISTDHITILADIDKNKFHQLQYQYSQFGDDNWQVSSKYLARNNGDIAYSLADYYTSLNQTSDAVHWYQVAYKQGSVKAVKPLAEYWFDTGQWFKSSTLAKTQSEHFWAQALIVNIAIKQGQLSEISDLSAKIQQTFQGNVLLTTLKKYQVLNQETSLATIASSSCLSLQMFATTLEDLKYTSELITQINSTEIGHYFCFPTPRYISKSALACQHSPMQAISCNETIWHQYLGNINTHYLGVMVPKGGANVHSGILYLDREDDVDVFKHELLHLLGFVDEYPLPINHPFCHSEQAQASSHNVVVLAVNNQGTRMKVRKKILAKVPWGHLIKASTPVVHKTVAGWQVGTPEIFQDEIGLFPVDTCQNETLVSVKPIAKATSLTYFELAFPQEYKDFLLSASRKYIMPSFHYNVIAALEKTGDNIGAQAWLNEAGNF